MFLKDILLYLYSNIFIRFSKNFSRENLYEYIEFFIDNYLDNYIKELNKEKVTILNIWSWWEVEFFLKKRLSKYDNLYFLSIDIDASRNPDIVLDIQNMYKLKDEIVDVIFCIEVLEHVPNPFKAVEEIYRILSKWGFFVWSTPFIFPIHDAPHDYYRFTKYWILYLFNKFSKILLKERNNYIKSCYVILLRLLNIWNVKQKIIAVFLFPLFVFLYPIILFLSIFVTNSESTTWYFYIFKKTV